MSQATATVTGNTGPGGVVTSLVLEDIAQLEFDFQHNMINFTFNSGKTFKLSWTGITTVTFSVSGGNATVVIS